MPEVILSNVQTTERFIEYTATTRLQLIAELNNNHEGMSSVVAFGQAQDSTWYAVLDRALQVILTMEDVSEIQHNRENEDTSDIVLRDSKLSLSA